jgi:hypothetical protein
MGRHSWCKPCANAAQKASRQRHGRPERKKRWQIKSRYGLTEAEVAAMYDRQAGKCAICRGEMKRQCIDHSHMTGKVRGLLCHRCNIALPYVEDRGFCRAATAYLEASQ